MFINFYSLLAVSNLSSMLKCVLLLPSDCVYVRYCNEIISSPIKGANRPLCGGETSRWRNVLGANRPGGETSKGRNVQRAKRLGGETSSYSYSYRVTLFNELFSEESCSVIGLSEKMGFQL